jgi:hypothetical protein
MDDLKKYQLKDMFHHLFTNLSGGQAFTLKDAFNDPKSASRKSFSSAEEARSYQETMQKLIASGFVSEISTGITVNTK